jgi:hypothetical protein
LAEIAINRIGGFIEFYLHSDKMDSIFMLEKRSCRLGDQNCMGRIFWNVKINGIIKQKILLPITI